VPAFGRPGWHSVAKENARDTCGSVDFHEKILANNVVTRGTARRDSQLLSSVKISLRQKRGVPRLREIQNKGTASWKDNRQEREDKFQPLERQVFLPT
jgi:hypothetical protein